MATEQVYYLVFAAVVLGVAVVAVLLLALRRLKQRKAQLLSELRHSPRLDSDRAFNRLGMARREADIVARQGTDVARARELIAQAQSAMDLRQFDRAYELAQSAHESLVQARAGGTAPLRSADPFPSRSGPLAAAAAAPSGPAPAGRGSPSDLSAPTPPNLPRGRAEAQFQLRLLDSEVDAATARRADDPETRAGIELQREARTAFEAGRYTDALRLALKGRRGLGGNVETVATSPATRGAAPDMPRVDVQAAAESAASASRCPLCGHPTTAADLFCRGCGSPRTPTACPKCGAARGPADTFCGQCGERFS